MTWKPRMTASVLGVAVAFATGVAIMAQQSVTRREPQFENSDVRVWKSIIAPNQPLTLHRHDHGRTIVVLKGGTLDVVDEKGRTKEQYVWESGKAYWLGADPPDVQHGDLNRGRDPIEVIVVELKRDRQGR